MFKPAIFSKTNILGFRYSRVSICLGIFWSPVDGRAVAVVIVENVAGESLLDNGTLNSLDTYRTKGRKILAQGRLGLLQFGEKSGHDVRIPLNRGTKLLLSSSIRFTQW